jgi:hypothetical protein
MLAANQIGERLHPVTSLPGPRALDSEIQRLANGSHWGGLEMRVAVRDHGGDVDWIKQELLDTLCLDILRVSVRCPRWEPLSEPLRGPAPASIATLLEELAAQVQPPPEQSSVPLRPGPFQRGNHAHGLAANVVAGT